MVCLPEQECWSKLLRYLPDSTLAISTGPAPDQSQLTGKWPAAEVRSDWDFMRWWACRSLSPSHVR